MIKSKGKKCTIISSIVSKRGITPAGIAYLCTTLNRMGYDFQLKNITGTIDYFNAPDPLYSKYNSPLWLNPRAITGGDWMDSFLPKLEIYGDIVFFSAVFSPDIVFHCRLSYKIKARFPHAFTVIGGSALMGLKQEQINLILSFFDFILIGYNVKGLVEHFEQALEDKLFKNRVFRSYSAPSFIPDYSLFPVEKFVNVYSGHGCYYGKCRFCDYPSRADSKVYFRAPKVVAQDLFEVKIAQPKVSDIVLSQDSYTKDGLIDTCKEITLLDINIPFNLMLRAEDWITEDIGAMLAESGCTDVFIGAEALNDNMLRILNKGVSIKSIMNSINILSKHVDVTIGLIMFIPGVNISDLKQQLSNLESIIPNITSIEPEVLTVVNGSYFSKYPKCFGIKLDATTNILNDRWCFGLSQDIPWEMLDKNLEKAWFDYAAELRKMTLGLVKEEYWDAVDCLK